MMIATRYIDDAVGKQGLATLHRLIDTANEEILMTVGVKFFAYSLRLSILISKPPPKKMCKNDKMIET